MLNNCNRILSAFLFFLLTALVLSSCASDKRTVDPYPDSSYTSSVPPARPEKTRPAPAPEKTLQKKAVVKPAVRQQAQPSDVIASNTMLPLLTLVDDRIVAYEVKIEQWKKFTAEASSIKLDEEQQGIIEECQRQLTSILNGYNDLHQQLISGSNGHAMDVLITERFLATERQDLSFLENACQQVMMPDLQTGGWVEGTRDRLVEEKEREINESMVSGEYFQVIELYGQLPVNEDGKHASYNASYSYGQALLRSGRENDAAGVFQDLLAGLQEQNQMEREFKLMQLIADIQFGMENYDKSFERYIDIINRYAGLGENIEWARKQQSMISVRNSQAIEVKNFSKLMRSYLTYNADRDAFSVFLLATRFQDDFPESSMLPTVNNILLESRDRAEAWFVLVLQQVNMLKAEMKYQEALQIIDQLPRHEMPMDKVELLNSLTDDLTAASLEEEESRRLAAEEAMQDIWSTGQNHLRTKEYDQAIEVFSTLRDTIYAERASDKITEAAQLAAQEDRRKAAGLFVRASKTKNQDTRIALLLESRQLLKGILKKYPQSGLIEKAENNLYRIEEDIRSIDPALLIEPEGTADDQETLQQPINTSGNGIPNGEW